MIPWIRKILGLCEHNWKTIDIADNIDTAYSRRYGKTVINGQIFYLQCEKCAKIKKQVV